MPIDVENQSGIDIPEQDLLSLLTFAMDELGLNAECELNILFVDIAEMTELHIKWMDEPGPTDVLSFPMDELEPHSAEIGVLGDIVVCPQVALEQATSAHHSFEHELSILSVHGLLHIVGYDHANPSDEKEMFDLQELIVANWRAQA